MVDMVLIAGTSWSTYDKQNIRWFKTTACPGYFDIQTIQNLQIALNGSSTHAVEYILSGILKHTQEILSGRRMHI